MSPKVCGKWQHSECVWQVEVSVCVWQASASECVWRRGSGRRLQQLKRKLNALRKLPLVSSPAPSLCGASSKLRKLCQPSLIFCCSICCNALLCASHDIFKNSLQNVCFVLRFYLPPFSPSSTLSLSFVLQFISLKWHLVVALVWSVPATPTP